MPLAVLSLAILHAIDWRVDVRRRGLGADGAFWLMIVPYKRLIVMHFCILGFGLTLELLGDPGMACVLIIGLKTAFDVYHHTNNKEVIRIDHKRLMELKDLVLKRHLYSATGSETRFASYTRMAESAACRKWLSIQRIALNQEEFAELETYLGDKLVRERGQAERQAAA